MQLFEYLIKPENGPYQSVMATSLSEALDQFGTVPIEAAFARVNPKSIVQHNESIQ